jgi:nucleotide-binding universal stress UspA family protein
MKMRGIIVGTDGSAGSHKALEWAVREAGIRKAPLTVLTVQQPVDDFFGTAIAHPGDHGLTELARKAALAETEEVLDQARDDPCPTSVAIQAVVGVPAEELLRAAVEADMIVVGSRGAGGLKKILLGSVSSHAAHHGNCPVVIIPSNHGPRLPRHRPGRSACTAPGRRERNPAKAVRRAAGDVCLGRRKSTWLQVRTPACPGTKAGGSGTFTHIRDGGRGGRLN